MPTTLTLPVGRIVSGHPMKFNPKTDDNKQPKFNKDGSPTKEAFFALAIPKNAGEAHWSQTTWGKSIYDDGVASWPRGEHQLPTFAWKIIDGDSRTPNTKMRIPADREGYPGHWVISFSTQFALQCFHPAQNGVYPQMQSDAEIKAGDYVMVQATFKTNESTKTAGMYANPNMVLLVSSGVAILGAEGNPNDAFGAVAPQLPQGAQVAPAGYVAPAPVAQAFTPPPAPVQTVVTPAPDFINPPAPVQERVLSNGFTASALITAGWTPAQVASLG